ncbi:methyltransferase domain-containing protein [Brevibacillus sp. SYP-B805]|uniref:methyltransferase domain-containing protein n=1 Tax=Brevibacillus sp. SYP-B805 TaxID=1578199 RepID=UPI0013EA9366|nr:methyltransferase domain-containing protein [Brevibacillus sp. SYP-B805]NGQ93930.1 methyltransferase domain-containing protein [Brevibacillus sp. SYP-B805]
MTNIIKKAELVSRFESAFTCPHCESSMKVVDWKSLICANKHTFDITKQGYLNMMIRPSHSHYNKELFEARHKTISESSLYAPMHKWIAKAIKQHVEVSTDPVMVLDAGCGEGSHLQKILDDCMCPTITGFGIDISKEGIAMAAKRYKNSLWMVGDLARTPFKDRSFQVILSILSPSNYTEFKRILIQDGLVIKVLPRPNYLKELREELFDTNSKKVYQNEKTVSLFKEHLQLLEAFQLRYTQNLSQSELPHIVQMTPLAWSADRERIKTYLKKDSAEITVDLEILVGMKKQTEKRR